MSQITYNHTIQPLVSIIIATYNKGYCILETLQSVLSQTYQNWECIIVDDGSTDDTKTVVNKFIQNHHNFTYSVVTNAGVSAARNLGFSKAKGAYIQFLDGDDVLAPQKIEHQIIWYNNNTSNKNAIVYASARYFSVVGQYTSLHPRGFSPLAELKYHEQQQLPTLALGNICTNCGPLYPNEFLASNGILHKTAIYEDWLFNLECVAKGARFHHHYNSNGLCYIRLGTDSQMLRHNVATREEFNKFLKEKNELVVYGGYSQFVVPYKQEKPKNFVRLLIPPILLEIRRLVKSKFSS